MKIFNLKNHNLISSFKYYKLRFIRFFSFYKIIIFKNIYFKYINFSYINFKNINLKKFNYLKIYNIFLSTIYKISRFFKKINFKNYKYFITYISTFVLFTLLVYLNIPLLLNYNKSNVVNKVCTNLKINCAIEGKINYRFFPSPRVVINNFILNDFKDKTKTLGRVEKVIIKLPIHNLHLNKNFYFKNIIFNNAKINFDINDFASYEKPFKKEFYKRNIFFLESKLNIFDGKNIVATINNIDLEYKSKKKIDKLILNGDFLNDKINLKIKNIKDKKKEKNKKIISFKLAKSEIFLKTVITEYNSLKDFVGTFSIKRDKNTISAIFSYKDDRVIFDKASIGSSLFDGKFNGVINFNPFFDFDLNLDLDSFNFIKLNQNLSKIEENKKKDLFKISKKINGQLNLNINKIFSKYSLIKSMESQIKFLNGDILFNKLLLDLGKLGAMDITGVIDNQKKYSILKFEKNLFVDNLRRFYRKFGLNNKDKGPVHLFTAGNFDISRLKLSISEISNESKINKEDINYIEKEFNNIVLIDGYKSLFNFLLYKEFIDAISEEMD